MDWAIHMFVRLSCQKIPTSAEKQVLQKTVLGLKNKCCDVSKNLESSSRTRENIHPSNTKILICYSPRVWNLFLLILCVKGEMCLLFERVSTPTFTSTFVNVFIIKLLVRWWYRWCWGEDGAPPDVEPSNDNNSERNRSFDVSNNISGSEVIDVTDTLETIMSTDTIVNSKNEIKDIIIDKQNSWNHWTLQI